MITIPHLRLSTEELVHWLSTCDEPWLSAAGPTARVGLDAWETDHGGLVYRLDACRMATVGAAYEEMASQFRFPSYFGHNLNALRDVMTDDAVLVGVKTVVYVSQPKRLLSHEPEGAALALLETFWDVARCWNTPEMPADGESPPCVPFHFLFEDIGEV